MLNLLFGVRGRIGRGSWWLAQFIAIPVVVLMGLGGLAGTVGLDDSVPSTDASGAMGFFVILIAVVASVWINVASTVKRFHDRGKSGAWFVVVFIPFIGGVWQLVECGFCTGDDGDNAYGPPPGSVSAQELAGATAGSGKLAKLDDDYFRNYAATQANRMSEPMVQSTYARPASTVTPGSQRPAFGKR